MSKRFFSILLTLLLVLSLVPFSASAEGEVWKAFYVSPTGDDNGSGTQSSSFKTLERVRDEVRKHNKNMQGDITVNLMPGRYELSDFLELKMEDSGSNGFDVIWQGTDPDNLPVISGAKEITGEWTEGENGIWHVKAENLKYVRDLFINGKVGTRARNPKLIYGTNYYDGPVYVDTKTGAEEKSVLGFYVSKSYLDCYENPEDIEFYWKDTFRTATFHVDDIIQDPANENQVIAIMDRRVWHEYAYADRQNASAKGNPAGPYRGFLVENAYELLDEPGEFYFNKKTKVLSYIPREGEDMKTAEVLCPQLERLTYIHGENYYNRLHNLRFRNIQFSHTSDYSYEAVSTFGGQAEYHYNTFRPGPTTYSSNTVDWAENISFESCVFYGLGPVALHFRDGVFHSNVTGNVFADLGATGFMAGTANHKTFEELVETGGPYDVAWNVGYEASYQYNASNTLLNMPRVDEHQLDYTTPGWFSEPWAKEEGTCPWVKFQLETYYTIDSIQFKFPKEATEEQRSNYEVVVSYDREFTNPKVVASFTEPTDFEMKIPVADGEKYRFVMLRKTEPGPFSLGSIWVWSYDRMALGNMGVPQDCTISDNYFTRVATNKRAAYPIMVNYTKGFDIINNEIADAPYSGISVGWGWEWALAKTTGNNNISYNRINNVMMTSSDGAGIYIFGEQPGSKLEGNFVSNTLHNAMALYYDTGGKGISSDRNVAMNTGCTFLAKLTLENTVKNMWTADYGYYRIYESRTDSFDTFEDPKPFSYNNPPDDVRRIMAEAGIRDEWLWIKERIPEPDTQKMNISGPDSGNIINDRINDRMVAVEPRDMESVEMANAMLNTGTIGSLPWEFDAKTMQDIKFWRDAMTNNNNRSDDKSGGHIEEMLALDEAIRAANDSVYHPSYEEMLAMCDDVKASATSKDYPQKAIDAFKKEVERVRATNPEQRGDKAVAAGYLERAYTELYYQSYHPELVGAVVEDAVTTIDKANKKITIELPYGVTAAEAVPTLYTDKASEIADDITDLDYSDGKVVVPLKRNGRTQVEFWTVELLEYNEKSEKGHISTEASDWVGGNENATISNMSGVVTIEPWFQPTMNKQAMDGSYAFSLWAPRADTKDGISLIFSSQTENLLATNYNAKNSYYMATIKDATLTLYKVVGGKSETCATVKDVSFNYDAYNDFEIEVAKAHNYDRITLKLNDEVVLDILEDAPIGGAGFFGIITKNMAVRVK